MTLRTVLLYVVAVPLVALCAWITALNLPGQRARPVVIEIESGDDDSWPYEPADPCAPPPHELARFASPSRRSP